MIDPFTILSAATLARISSKLFDGINLLIGKYPGVDILLCNLSTQCSLVNSAFARIQTLLRDEPGCFHPQEGEGIDFTQNVENALIVAFRLFSTLDKEIAKMTRDSAQTMSRWGRLRASFNEDTLKDRSRQLQDCCSSIHFLLTVVTTYPAQ
jgi:hypothetical protein